LFGTALIVFTFSTVAIRSLREGEKNPSCNIRRSERKAVEKTVRKCSNCAKTIVVTTWPEFSFLP